MLAYFNYICTQKLGLDNRRSYSRDLDPFLQTSGKPKNHKMRVRICDYLDGDQKGSNYDLAGDLEGERLIAVDDEAEPKTRLNNLSHSLFSVCSVPQRRRLAWLETLSIVLLFHDCTSSRSGQMNQAA